MENINNNIKNKAKNNARILAAILFAVVGVYYLITTFQYLGQFVDIFYTISNFTFPVALFIISIGLLSKNKKLLFAGLVIVVVLKVVEIARGIPIVELDDDGFYNRYLRFYHYRYADEFCIYLVRIIEDIIQLALPIMLAYLCFATGIKSKKVRNEKTFVSLSIALLAFSVLIFILGIIGFDEIGEYETRVLIAWRISAGSITLILQGLAYYRLAFYMCDSVNTKKQQLPDKKKYVASAEDIMKLKELLDAGAITQEEFDEKKREML